MHISNVITKRFLKKFMAPTTEHMWLYGYNLGWEVSLKLARDFQTLCILILEKYISVWNWAICHSDHLRQRTGKVEHTFLLLTLDKSWFRSI